MVDNLADLTVRNGDAPTSLRVVSRVREKHGRVENGRIGDGIRVHVERVVEGQAFVGLRSLGRKLMLMFLVVRKRTSGELWNVQSEKVLLGFLLDGGVVVKRREQKWLSLGLWLHHLEEVKAPGRSKRAEKSVLRAAVTSGRQRYRIGEALDKH